MHDNVNLLVYCICAGFVLCDVIDFFLYICYSWLEILNLEMTFTVARNWCVVVNCSSYSTPIVLIMGLYHNLKSYNFHQVIEKSGVVEVGRLPYKNMPAIITTVLGQMVNILITLILYWLYALEVVWLINFFASSCAFPFLNNSIIVSYFGGCFMRTIWWAHVNRCHSLLLSVVQFWCNLIYLFMCYMPTR